MAPVSPESFAMPASNSGRFNQDQGVLPPRPPPPKAQPEEAVSWSEASIRPSQYAELVTKGDNLEQEIAARGEGRPECGDHPEGVTHRA
jgi:hypothetical protein